jgi:xanthine dehydrogenase small subunit
MYSERVMFEFVLNGRVARVPGASADMTLLDYLRARGLTGAKEGCAEGECGACAVVMRCGRPGESGSEYRAVNSCLMLLPMAAGREIDTVESLADDGQLAPAQQALAAAGGSQCGYCTPGFVMSLMAEYYRPGRVGSCDPRALDGNLCRCTGYRPIADAARSLGPATNDRFSARLEQPVPTLEQVTTTGFSRPTSIDACVALLRQDASATLVAGGTDLVVERNLRQRRWPHLVSVEAIDQLHATTDTPDCVCIGAARPLADLLRGWSDAPDAVREWVTLFASPLIRHRATLGGNLATASPIGDGAPLLLALDASIEIAGPAMDEGGRATRRVIPLNEFFTAYRRTRLASGELIVAIRIPRPFPRHLRFYKVAKRRLDDISTVAAAFAIDAPAGTVERARVAFGGVAATPVRLREAEAALEGHPWTLATISRVQDVVQRVLQPLSDHRGSREYRLAMGRCLIEKCWWESQP